jgi:frataxin-like iron-binding protein CyaY
MLASATRRVGGAVRRPANVLALARASASSTPREPRRLMATTPDGERPDEAVQRILAVMVEAREGCSDVFEPALQADGVLLLDLGSKGQYSLQPAEDEQLLLFSPISGPKYYAYDTSNRWWCAVDDGHLLDELLVRELMHTTSVYLNL